MLILSFTLLFMHKNAFSQQLSGYEKDWEKVASLEKQGLYRQAWNEVNSIYTTAVKRHDDQQQIKALIYQLKYRERIEENATVNNIQEVDSLAKNTQGIPKAILQNMLAEMYYWYVQSKRYQLYNRITSSAEKENDITTWSLTHFYNEIASLYKASLSNEADLKKIRLSSLEIIVDTGKNTVKLWPTLYDLLAHRALNYFTGEEQYVIHPAVHFIIEQPISFADPGQFIHANFQSSDSSSLQLYALHLYQQLMAFHLHDKNTDALMDVSMERLQYVYRKAVMSDKDSLYMSALERIIQGSSGNAAIAMASYLLANYYIQQGTLYDPFSHPENRYDLKKAVEICNSVAAKPVTFGSIKCQILKSEILNPYISVEAEQVNVPEKPFRVLIKYKNASHLYFRLVKLSNDPRTVFAERYKGKDYTLSLPVYRQWEQVFPDPKDYQPHGAEMKVEGLPVGRYTLIVSANKRFSKGKMPVESVEFFVSDISYIHNNDGGFLVLNRETGEPLNGVKITLWKTVYNATTRRNELERAGDYTPNRQGFFQVKAAKDYPGLMPEITVDGDHLFIGQPQYIPYVSSENKVKDTLMEKTYLFTDRFIYRPGQTIYFKGITFNFNPATHQSEVSKDKKETVYLYDANNQKADSLQLTTNDFGSIAGSFLLPTGLLNGQMHIEIKDQDVYNYFSVEDYKRPTFYLQWDTSSHPYSLGDNVSVKGSVIAYSQAVMEGAIVKYQVTRNTRTRFPYPPFGRMLTTALPAARQATITQSETKTDDKGNFEITFPAIPDESVDSSQHPVFIYAVSVDVTDINGESHHFNYELPLGYTSLQLQIEGADKVNLLKTDTIHISSTNLSGKVTPVSAGIHFYPLKSPDRFIRPRYWLQPDEFILSKKEYLQYFPHDEYQDESNPESREKLPAVLNLHQEVSENTAVVLPVNKLKPGWYAIEVNGKDEHGKSVSATKYIQAYNPESKKPVFHEPLWISKNDMTAQPGDKVSWYVSSDQPVNVIEQPESLAGAGDLASASLNNEINLKTIQVNEADHGGIIYHYMTVKDNRLFTQTVTIQVPWTNKRLEIQYETFRDKLLPGSSEEWKMKITGEGGQKVSAELLASMYDISLDAFRLNQWQLPDIYPDVSGRISWAGDRNFNDVGSTVVSFNKPVNYPPYEKIYPSMKWFGYSPGGFSPHGVYSYAMSETPSPSKYKVGNDHIVEKRIAGISEDTTAGNSLQSELQNISPRTNFNETAFFFPQLHTDDSGNVIFSFTMPEALTKWKLMMFANTKDMQFAYSDKEVATQKPLMIQANAPRFVRQGDQLIFSAKVSNLSKDNLNGNAQLELTDAVTGKPVNDLFKNINTKQSFDVNASQSTAVKWNITVPENYTGALEYKVVASAGNFSDGEQDVLPVLTNKTFVIESLPLNFRGNGDHHFDWKVLNQLGQSSSMQPIGLTIEYAGNPVWYAVQALPFLDEDNQQSTDVLYNRFYANALSSVIAKDIPDFQYIMHAWPTKDTHALKSPLERNENLKTVLLQETPWVRAGQGESAQKHRVAEWFEGKDFKASMQEAVMKLKQFQLSNGGFSWFKDMPDNRFVTQQIVTGIGHLKQLQAWPREETASLNDIVQKAVPYIDARMKEDYEQIIKQNAKDPQINSLEIQYLYMRSFFPAIKMEDSVKSAYLFFQKLAAKQWLNKSPYMQSMTALALFRSGNVATAKSILQSLSETSINDPVKGMYWKNNQYGYLWYQAPLEAQAVCIEAFNEINHDTKTVSNLCTWLLTQKQTQHWVTNRATADAIYALLIAGNQWTSAAPSITIKLGEKAFGIHQKNSEAGTQYKEEYIPGKEVTADMSKVKVHIKDAAKDEPTWGALYFQYFEDMNKVENSSSSPLTIERQILLERNTPDGQELIPIAEGVKLKVGDKVQVRLVVKINEDMDYVHLKDVRASCMEPLQTLSGYQWQSGTGYYFTMTDAAVHYYFGHLNKGTYVFSYPVYITHAGDYTGGLSTIECLYAPQFRAHSEGIRINVK